MRKRRRKKSKAPVIVLIVILLIVFLVTKDDLSRHFIYPNDYYEEIMTAAQAHDIDTALLLAVVREESRFDKNALSKVGAQGLMQLMPNTAAWICDHAPFDYDSVSDVWDPAANIMMGSWYLSWLASTYYEGNLAAAIAAYNAGQQNVNDWLKEGRWDGSFQQAQDIPFGETAAFLKSVDKSRHKYEKLYDLSANKYN